MQIVAQDKQAADMGLEYAKNASFFVDGANWLSPGHHTLRLTCGPAGNRTATGSMSATSRTSPYQLLHRDAYAKNASLSQKQGTCPTLPHGGAGGILRLYAFLTLLLPLQPNSQQTESEIRAAL